MIGIDVTRISRFNNKNKKFLEKVLHVSEIEEYEKIDDKPKFLATRWAIKEAIYKSDNRYHSFRKINITKKDRKYIFEDYEISTSSEDNILIAIVKKRGNNE